MHKEIMRRLVWLSEMNKGRSSRKKQVIERRAELDGVL
jgi:hypothetical protein